MDTDDDDDNDDDDDVVVIYQYYKDCWRKDQQILRFVLQRNKNIFTYSSFQ